MWGKRRERTDRQSSWLKRPTKKIICEFFVEHKVWTSERSSPVMTHLFFRSEKGSRKETSDQIEWESFKVIEKTGKTINSSPAQFLEPELSCVSFLEKQPHSSSLVAFHFSRTTINDIPLIKTIALQSLGVEVQQQVMRTRGLVSFQSCHLLILVLLLKWLQPKTLNGRTTTVFSFF